MSGYGDMGKGIMDAVSFLLVVVCVAVPLGVWKLIDIVLWLVRHVDIHWVKL